MSISLTVKTQDRALEALLHYLNTHGDHPSTVSKLHLLEKAGKWLRASLPVAYDCRSDEISIALEPGDGEACSSALRSR